MHRLESALPALFDGNSAVEERYYVPPHLDPKTNEPCNYGDIFVFERNLNIASATSGSHTCQCGVVFETFIL